MKYERLTKKNRRSDAIEDMLKSKYSKSKYSNNTAIKRLAELEDKIDDGTLIEVPYKVGDMVYGIGGIFGDVIYGCIRTIQINEFTTKYILEKNCYFYLMNEVFLTEAEAWKRLEELIS